MKKSGIIGLSTILMASAAFGKVEIPDNALVCAATWENGSAPQYGKITTIYCDGEKIPSSRFKNSRDVRSGLKGTFFGNGFEYRGDLSTRNHLVFIKEPLKEAKRETQVLSDITMMIPLNAKSCSVKIFSRSYETGFLGFGEPTHLTYFVLKCEESTIVETQLSDVDEDELLTGAFSALLSDKFEYSSSLDERNEYFFRKD